MAVFKLPSSEDTFEKVVKTLHLNVDKVYPVNLSNVDQRNEKLQRCDNQHFYDLKDRNCKQSPLLLNREQSELQKKDLKICSPTLSELTYSQFVNGITKRSTQQEELDKHVFVKPVASKSCQTDPCNIAAKVSENLPNNFVCWGNKCHLNKFCHRTKSRDCETPKSCLTCTDKHKIDSRVTYADIQKCKSCAHSTHCEGKSMLRVCNCRHFHSTPCGRINDDKINCILKPEVALKVKNIVKNDKFLLNKTKKRKFRGQLVCNVKNEDILMARTVRDGKIYKRSNNLYFRDSNDKNINQHVLMCPKNAFKKPDRCTCNDYIIKKKCNPNCMIQTTVIKEDTKGSKHSICEKPCCNHKSVDLKNKICNTKIVKTNSGVLKPQRIEIPVIPGEKNCSIDLMYRVLQVGYVKSCGFLKEIIPSLKHDEKEDAIQFFCKTCSQSFSFCDVRSTFNKKELFCFCPNSRHIGSQKKIYAELCFKLIVKDLNNSFSSYLLIGKEAEAFFGCTVSDFWLSSDIRHLVRRAIRNLLRSYDRKILSEFCVSAKNLFGSGPKYLVNVRKKYCLAPFKRKGS